MPAKKTATKKAFQKPKLKDPRRLHFKLGLLDLDSKKKTHGKPTTRGS